jgi:hypothetical protein
MASKFEEATIMLGFLWARKVKVEIEKPKLDLQPEVKVEIEKPKSDTQPECKPPDHTDLRAAYNLISYIWTASANKEELILPNFAFYNAWERPIYTVNRSIVASWLENIERVKKDRTEKKELTAKIEEILASEYGIIKPKESSMQTPTKSS